MPERPSSGPSAPESLPESERTARIAFLNDQFRTTFVGGEVLLTQGVAAMGHAFIYEALDLVRQFAEFTPDNNPYRERDFGRFRLAGVTLYWKIDYYAKVDGLPELSYGSEDPSDPEQTHRVLTLLKAEEY